MSDGTEDDRWLDVKRMMGERRITFGRHISYWVHHSPRRLLHSMSYYKFAAKVVGKERRVLDVGCGEGLGTWLMAVECGRAHGVDLDGEAIEQADRNFGVDPRISFSSEDFLAMSGEPWDALVSFDLIEHIQPADVGAFWSHVASRLRHDGVAVIGTPNITSDVYASPISRAGHVNLYDGERLLAEAREHFHHAFLFGANDEVVHTGYPPMCHYLMVLACRPRGA